MKKITTRMPISKKLRFAIFDRDKFICQYCGRTPEQDNVTLVVDHAISVKQSGPTHPDNLVTSCFDCNAGKGAKSVIRATQTPADVQEQLERTQERLAQLIALNKTRQKIGKINEKIDNAKLEWIKEIIGTEYNNPKIYSEIQKAVDARFPNMEKTVIEALEITHAKHCKEGFREIPAWIAYFCGVCKNLSLSFEQKEVLRLYYEIYKYERMIPVVRKLILDYSRLGTDFHSTVIFEIEAMLRENWGKTFATRDDTRIYINKHEFTVYKSGFNFHILVCEMIVRELEGYVGEDPNA